MTARIRTTIAAGLLGLASAATAQAPVAPIEVRAAHFFADRFDGDRVFSAETTRIPFEPEVMCYRWVLDTKPAEGVRAVRERMTLPAAAAHWGGVDGVAESPTALAPSRDVAETDFIVALSAGSISHGWCVAEGDPPGPYRIDVLDGARLLHRFDFTVGASGRRR